MNLYNKRNRTYPKTQNQPSDTDYYFDGWNVHLKDNKYFIRYISGALQGELKTHEINKEDFDLAKEGKINLDELCTKYGIY